MMNRHSGKEIISKIYSTIGLMKQCRDLICDYEYDDDGHKQEFTIKPGAEEAFEFIDKSIDSLEHLLSDGHTLSVFVTALTHVDIIKGDRK